MSPLPVITEESKHVVMGKIATLTQNLLL